MAEEMPLRENHTKCLFLLCLCLIAPPPTHTHGRLLNPSKDKHNHKCPSTPYHACRTSFLSSSSTPHTVSLNERLCLFRKAISIFIRLIGSQGIIMNQPCRFANFRAGQGFCCRLAMLFWRVCFIYYSCASKQKLPLHSILIVIHLEKLENFCVWIQIQIK